MGKTVYKYFGAGVLDLIFSKPGYCGIKCSLPKDYNDPYELFLGVDLSVSTDLLAAYQDFVQEVPQYPTTCFSRSPAVTPMWAHYANNHTGFVVEFDVDKLAAAFGEVVIEDVEYRSEPSEAIATWLAHAVGTRKPRHAHFLRQTVMHAAYFSKDVCWGYEQECRLLDQEGYCEDIGGNMILYVPIAACTAVIAGKNADAALLARSREVAAQTGFRWYQEFIGRSAAQPFMVADDGSRFVFEDGMIRPAAKVCAKCSEPIEPTAQLCPWCSITEAHALAAARGNSLRMLDRHGMLDDYFRDMEAIARSHRKT